MAQSIGAQLKEIRQSQGIPLEQIALKTRISLTYLQAIEDGDIEALPSKVQLRGFLRLYAHELGVDLDVLRVADDYLTSDMSILPVNQEAEPEQAPQSTGIADDEQVIETEPEPEVIPATVVSPEQSLDTPSVSSPPAEQADLNLGAAEPKDSAVIFAKIGAKLKRRREMISLSISDIHNNIHIGEKHLESMEAGKFNELPSPVQARGMLINYAEFLNLDTDSILLEYTEALQLQRIEKQPQVSGKRKRSARELSPTALQLKNFFSLDLLVILGLFIILAIFVIWGVNRILSNEPSAVTDEDIPGVSDVLLASDTPTPIATQDQEITEIANGQNQETELEAEEEPLFTPVASTDPINIILVPRQRLWVRVAVDEDVVFQGRLLPGNAYDFSGQERVVILTGNAGALQIFFNNEDIGSAGLIGQVAELSFTENGRVLPPPTSTPTVTPTPETTPTPTPTPIEIND
jgi:cytoskeletal protein RodZ